MALTARDMKDNRDLKINVSSLSGLFSGTRALVIKEPISGLEELNVSDYYHLIIAESPEVLESIQKPDFLVYQYASAYKDHVLYLDSMFNYPDTLFVLNWQAVKEWSKFNKSLRFYSLSYLEDVNGQVSSKASTAKGIEAGLSSSAPGVHLAKICGCSSIYYTGQSADATTVSIDDISSFITDSGKYIPKNLIQPNRKTILNTYFL